ncbi:MAG: ATP-binding protein [Chloroflexota bacterium]
MMDNELRISIPTLNDSPVDFRDLFKLVEDILVDADCGADITLEFSQCRFLSQNAVATIGALYLFMSQSMGQECIALDIASMQPAVRANLAQNGLLAALGIGTKQWDGNSVPFRNDIREDPDTVLSYLKEKWLGKGWINLTPILRDAIVGNVWEIYTNAFEHSGSTVGIISCGQHFPRNKELKLTAVDMGVGIPEKVRAFLTDDLGAADALAWAFRPGSTTNPGGIGRGMGLDLLADFVTVNSGRLEVYSLDGYARIDDRGAYYADTTTRFPGTLVNITFRCDESLYHLENEPEDEPYF